MEVLQINGLGSQYRFNELLLFPNLSSLSIRMYNQDTLNVLMAATFSLTRFDATISLNSHIEMDNIFIMFAAPSLKMVERLTFRFEADVAWDLEEWTEEVCNKLTRSIASNLTFLTNIILGIPFRKTSFQHFIQFSNIRTVQWEGRLIDVEDTDDAPFAKDIARAAVEGAFISFEKKPECNTTVVAKRERRVVRMFRHYY
jgi:hypothetical protein